jgi:hypothetical protein
MLVLLLMTLVLVEGAGVARAFGSASSIECCCGKHAKARPCGCRSCPAKRGRHDAAADTTLTERAPCSGGDTIDDGAILQVVAEAPAAPPLLSPAPPAGAILLVVVTEPPSRVADPARPPP